MKNALNKLFNKSYDVWYIEEFFDNDEKLIDGVDWITRILSLKANNIDGKIIDVDRSSYMVKVGFKKKTDRSIYMKGSNKYVDSIAQVYNVTTGHIAFNYN